LIAPFKGGNVDSEFFKTKECEILANLFNLFCERKSQLCVSDRTTDTAFVLLTLWPEGEQRVFLRCNKEKIFLFYLLPQNYNSVALVPGSMWRLVSQGIFQNELIILRLPVCIDDINLADVISKKESDYSFAFWAVREILFQRLSFNTFSEKLVDFIKNTRQLAVGFAQLYKTEG
jgi:hypothetical protein